jgi:hypothetical protein
MTYLIGIAIALFTVIFTLYGLIVLPVIMTIRCANNESLSKRSKACWIVACIFLWPIGPCVYGLIHARWGINRILCFFYPLVWVAIFGFPYFYATHSQQRDIATIEQMLNDPAMNQSPEVSLLRDDLDTLKTQLATRSRLENLIDHRTEALGTLRNALHDHELTAEEYEAWRTVFHFQKNRTEQAE